MKKAIDIGYRHFDTAFLYNTEIEVGEAVRDKIAEGVVKREDLFIATKVNISNEFLILIAKIFYIIQRHIFRI